MRKTPWTLSILGLTLLTMPISAQDRQGAAGRASANNPSVTELRPLFNAIRQVETGGEKNPREARGDQGRSLGPYQISRAYWQDSGVGGHWRRCKERRHAEAAMLAYWQRHCPQALRQRDFRTLARVHNGGPAGHRKAATKLYWEKVKHRL